MLSTDNRFKARDPVAAPLSASLVENMLDARAEGVEKMLDARQWRRCSRHVRKQWHRRALVRIHATSSPPRPTKNVRKQWHRRALVCFRATSSPRRPTHPHSTQPHPSQDPVVMRASFTAPCDCKRGSDAAQVGGQVLFEGHPRLPCPWTRVASHRRPHWDTGTR